MKGNCRNTTTGRVLIIEGSPILQNAANCLINAGFKVASVPSQSDTLLILGNFNFDVVVTDKVTGDSAESCRKIQNVFGAPVIVID